MGRRRGEGQTSVLALIGLTQESQAGAVVDARQTLGLAVCFTVPINVCIPQLCGAMMVVKVAVTMHPRRMSRLVSVMRESRSVRLRIMGMAVGVLTMRMFDTVHGVVSMPVII
ncbi:MAG: hypothetical protein CMQ69_03095 [Gammaproteobacteria bacterium]|nr:hypothetical protein [Gammaproteobacteria bacterium]|tara:strand:+ start:1337 stop:1675 length:339 start_codon:yes stop_codon:yes gene_type:complete